MKHIIKTTLAFTALAGVSACGLRGDLERPDPIFSDPPSEEAMVPVDTVIEVASTRIDPNRTYYNTLGGEIPKPAPVTDVQEESMGEVSPG